MLETRCCENKRADHVCPSSISDMRTIHVHVSIRTQNNYQRKFKQFQRLWLSLRQVLWCSGCPRIRFDSQFGCHDSQHDHCSSCVVRMKKIKWGIGNKLSFHFGLFVSCLNLHLAKRNEIHAMTLSWRALVDSFRFFKACRCLSMGIVLPYVQAWALCFHTRWGSSFCTGLHIDLRLYTWSHCCFFSLKPFNQKSRREEHRKGSKKHKVKQHQTSKPSAHIKRNSTDES